MMNNRLGLVHAWHVVPLRKELETEEALELPDAELPVRGRCPAGAAACCCPGSLGTRSLPRPGRPMIRTAEERFPATQGPSGRLWCRPARAPWPHSVAPRFKRQVERGKLMHLVLPFAMWSRYGSNISFSRPSRFGVLGIGFELYSHQLYTRVWQRAQRGTCPR